MPCEAGRISSFYLKHNRVFFYTYLNLLPFSLAWINPSILSVNAEISFTTSSISRSAIRIKKKMGRAEDKDGEYTRAWTRGGTTRVRACVWCTLVHWPFAFVHVSCGKPVDAYVSSGSEQWAPARRGLGPSGTEIRFTATSPS